jgi:hypothetical protein
MTAKLSTQFSFMLHNAAKAMLTRTKGKVDQRSEENRQRLLLAALHFVAKEEQPLVTQAAKFEVAHLLGPCQLFSPACRRSAWFVQVL